MNSTKCASKILHSPTGIGSPPPTTSPRAAGRRSGLVWPRTRLLRRNRAASPRGHADGYVPCGRSGNVAPSSQGEASHRAPATFRIPAQP